MAIILCMSNLSIIFRAAGIKCLPQRWAPGMPKIMAIAGGDSVNMDVGVVYFIQKSILSFRLPVQGQHMNTMSLFRELSGQSGPTIPTYTIIGRIVIGYEQNAGFVHKKLWGGYEDEMVATIMQCQISRNKTISR